MDETGFWQLIDNVHHRAGGDMDRKCEAVRDAISDLPGDEAAEFARRFDEMMARAYDWQLWGAAYVIHGGCSDDSFDDFRSALISRGRQRFESALADPDSLAEEPFDEDDWYYEGYLYAVMEGAETAIGSHPPRGPFPKDPAGKPWDEDDTVLKAMFPRLWERHEATWSADPNQDAPIPPPPYKKPWWKFWG